MIESRSVNTFAEEMLQEGLISRGHVASPTYHGIMGEYLGTFPFISDYLTVKCRILKFVSILKSWGGGYTIAAEKLEKDCMIMNNLQLNS